MNQVLHYLPDGALGTRPWSSDAIETSFVVCCGSRRAAETSLISGSPASGYNYPGVYRDVGCSAGCSICVHRLLIMAYSSPGR